MTYELLIQSNLIILQNNLNMLDMLVEDIFLLVFDYLDEKDLDSCENVCLEWQKLIQSHTWKKRLQVKVF